METQITLDGDEIKKAIKHYVGTVLNKEVVIHKYYKTAEIHLSHSEDDRASGVFHYSVYVKIANWKIYKWGNWGTY